MEHGQSKFLAGVTAAFFPDILLRRGGEGMASGGSAARQLEEIEAALSVPRSASPFDPCICPLSAAYATHFDLMRRVSSAADLPEEHLGLHSLSLHCRSLILTMISGVASPDEETAALALKCLGFMFYHPAISSGIPGSVAGQVVEALAKLVEYTDEGYL